MKIVPLFLCLFRVRNPVHKVRILMPASLNVVYGSRYGSLKKRVSLLQWYSWYIERKLIVVRHAFAGIQKDGKRGERSPKVE